MKGWTYGLEIYKPLLCRRVIKSLCPRLSIHGVMDRVRVYQSVAVNSVPPYNGLL